MATTMTTGIVTRCDARTRCVCAGERRRAIGARRARTTRRAGDAGEDGLQLGTAKLPGGVDEGAMCDALYQWASSLTTNGANLPFALAQGVERTSDGFELTFLKRTGDGPEMAAVGTIAASVESAPSGDRVLMIRGFGNVMQCVDTPVVMGGMPAAIRKAILMSS